MKTDTASPIKPSTQGSGASRGSKGQASAGGIPPRTFPLCASAPLRENIPSPGSASPRDTRLSQPRPQRQRRSKHLLPLAPVVNVVVKNASATHQCRSHRPGNSRFRPGPSTGGVRAGHDASGLGGDPRPQPSQWRSLPFRSRHPPHPGTHPGRAIDQDRGPRPRHRRPRDHRSAPGFFLITRAGVFLLGAWGESSADDADGADFSGIRMGKRNGVVIHRFHR